MKNTKLLLTLLFLFLYGGCACAQPKAPNLEYVRGDVLVVMDAPGGASDVEPLSGRVAEATGSKVIRSYEAIADATGKCVFQLKSAEKSVDDLLAEVRAMPGVRGATPNYIVKILGTPDDPELPSSWGIEHINAVEAWDLSTGGEDVYVAILDTGIKADHEDLAANIGQDGDGKFGRNLVSLGAVPLDDNGHGTLVAGIVGAVGNNGLGTTGVNWTTRLLGVKVMDGNGAGSYGHVIAGLDYVLGQKKLGLNIRVASMAFGAWTPEVEDLDYDPLAVACRAVSDAGVLLVAAAGNEGQNIDSAGGGYKGNKIYPASLSSEGVLTATAVMKSGAPVKSANYGLAVDVAAPGHEILSTAVDGGYQMINGTSAASGFTAGAAALIAATDPELTASQLKERILEFAGRDKALAGKTASGHLNVGAAVKNERGSVTVAIEGPGSSRWSLDGKGRYESGYILAGVPVGEHTVSYHEVDLWTAPADSLIAVAANAETEVGGQYRQQNASLWVVIEGPEEGGWSLNGEDRFESDQTIGKIAGKRTVTFSEVPGWDSPEPQAVTVPAKAPLALTGVYKRQTGSVVVTIIGPEGASWSLDGEGAYAGGEAAEGIPTGERTVSFAEVPNWDKPANIPVQVEKDSSVYSRGVYVQHVGSIRVNIEGPDDASWAINGRGLYADGETVSELPVGNYTLSFSAVRDWDSPSSIQVTVTRDSVAEVDRAYEKHTGSVAVAIDGPETAKWRLEGRDEQLAGGETLPEVPVGEYTVVFSDVADWHTPESTTVFVVKDSVGKAEGSYLQHKGSLTVDITEPVEATWSLDGEGVYASGEVVQGVVVGAHTISFSKVDEWDEPENLKVTVANESLAKAEVAYKRHRGAIQVNIDGPVEARWTMDGENFHKDGEVVRDLVVGDYTVTFYDLLDWDEPDDVSVTVAKDETAKVDAVFTIHRGSIRIPFSGPGEGRWILDGEGSYEKGETVDGVPVGTHRISFSQVDGWDSPKEFQLTVVKDSLAKAEPGYERHLGSVTVNIDGPAAARWSVDGEGSHSSGASVGGIVTGEHTVSFSDVSGWDTPLDHKLTVAKDAVTELKGVYGEHVGTVAVYIDGPEDARWFVEGVEGAFASGDASKVVPVGDRSVNFLDVDGWDSPEAQPITVFRNVTTIAAGEYRRQTGSLTVEIQGAQDALWSLDGEGEYAAGEVVQGLSTGEHTVSFADAEGWVAPEPVVATVEPSAMSSVEGVYTRAEEPVIEEPAEPEEEPAETEEEPAVEEAAVEIEEVAEPEAEPVVEEITVEVEEPAEPEEEPVVEEAEVEVEEVAEPEEEPVIEEAEVEVEEVAEPEEEPVIEEAATEVEEPAEPEEEPVVEETAVEVEEPAEPEEEPAIEEASVEVEEPAEAAEEPVIEEIAVEVEEPAEPEEEPVVEESADSEEAVSE